MSQIFPIIMPKWGLSMTEGIVTNWLYDEGVFVSSGVDLVDIETSKIVNALEAPSSGILRRKLANFSVSYPCGSLLGIIANMDVSDCDIDNFISAFISPDIVANVGVAGQETSFISIDTHDICYFVAGTGPETVLFLHGFGGDLDNWQFVQSIVSKTRFTVALDFPGHGRSSKILTSLLDIDILADFVAKFLRALNLHNVHVVAHSMGGAVASALAARHPLLISKLTLLAPAHTKQSINNEYLLGFISAKNSRELEPFINLLFSDKVFVKRSLLDDLMKYKRIDGVSEALTFFYKLLVSEDFYKYINVIHHSTMPITVLCGIDDQIISPSYCAFSRVLRPNLLDHVGHMPHLEAVSDVANFILGIETSI